MFLQKKIYDNIFCTNQWSDPNTAPFCTNQWSDLNTATEDRNTENFLTNSPTEKTTIAI